jgi:twitching motility two-component system response regulator PilH
MTKTILVVDDVLSERVNMMAILRKHGFETLDADTGVRAIEIAQARVPDAIIMDIVMPEMDGFAATKRLSEDSTTKAIPIVIVSSKARESDKWRAKKLGARGYLVKPVLADALIAVINGVL